MADITDDKALTESAFGDSLGIPKDVIAEVKVWAQSGWVKDGFGNVRELTPNEQKMVALVAWKTGLSVVGKHVIMLGDTLYVSKQGKVRVARHDKELPYVRCETRPATAEERKMAGLIYNDPEDWQKFEHYWRAEVYAIVAGSVEKVANSYGHACVANINLKGKTADPRRLCSGMAETRAVSRALSSVYDFFGMESMEEVAVARQMEQHEVIEAKSEVVGESKSVDDVLQLLEDNADSIPPEYAEKYSKEKIARMDGRTRDDLYAALAATIETNGGGAPDAVTLEQVLAFMEEHSDALPENLLKKYTRERLESYTQEALAEVFQELQDVSKAQPAERKKSKESGKASKQGAVSQTSLVG